MVVRRLHRGRLRMPSALLRLHPFRRQIIPGHRRGGEGGDGRHISLVDARMSHSSPATNQGALLGDVISACNNCRTHEPRETQQSVGCRWLLSVRPWLYPTRGSGGGGASGSLRGAGAGAGRRLCRRGHSRRGVAAPYAAVRAWLLLAQPVPGAPRIVLRVTPGALPQGPARLSGAVLCARVAAPRTKRCSCAVFCGSHLVWWLSKTKLNTYMKQRRNLSNRWAIGGWGY